ncbi:hypothetical protein BDAP_002273 [Binucleata daphniae]
MPSIEHYMCNNNSLIVIKSATILPHPSLAIFDLDDTLIKYHLPHTKPKFSFLYANTIQKLRNQSKTHSICIFSNQNKTINENTKKFFCDKIEMLINKLDIPVIFIGALEKDYNRKPRIGMLDYIRGIRSDIDTNNSFFVGDAAGRTKDHSDCNLKIAMNMKMRFYTPDEYFENKTEYLELVYYNLGIIKENVVEIYKQTVRPENMNDLCSTTNKQENTCKEINLVFENNHKKYDKNLVFLYGKGKFSGKKYFAKTNLKNYKILYDTKEYNKNEKCVIINCADKHFIVKNKENSTCVFLNYTEDVLRFLSHFSALTNKISTNLHKKYMFDDYKSLFAETNELNFVFDDSEQSKLERKIIQMIL